MNIVFELWYLRIKFKNFVNNLKIESLFIWHNYNKTFDSIQF